jgi:hypothetical protein
MHGGFRRGKLVPRERRLAPDQLNERQVRYYRNPLVRLIKMHSSFSELTGYPYISPWPRQDAQYRT